METRSIVIIAVIIFYFATKIVIDRKYQGVTPEMNDEGYFVLRLPWIQTILVLFFWVWWFFTFFLNDATLGRYIIIFLIMGLISTVMILNTNAKVRYSETNFYFPNFFGRTSLHKWSDIASIQTNTYSHGLIILKNGKNLRVNKRFIGVEHFMDFAQKKTSSENQDIIAE